MERPDPATQRTAGETLFAPPAERESSRSMLPWLIAAGVVLLGAAVVLLGFRSRPAASRGVLPLDAYASSLSLSAPVMSESTSLSGGKSTFLDGVVTNSGPRTITAVTVQVLFANDVGLPPQVETLPLTLVRTREPYVDTQPLSAAPLGPGQQREFRLIFENIADSWNRQLPEVRVVQVSSR